MTMTTEKQAAALKKFLELAGDTISDESRKEIMIKILSYEAGECLSKYLKIQDKQQELPILKKEKASIKWINTMDFCSAVGITKTDYMADAVKSLGVGGVSYMGQRPFFDESIIPFCKKNIEKIKKFSKDMHDTRCNFVSVKFMAESCGVSINTFKEFMDEMEITHESSYYRKYPRGGGRYSRQLIDLFKAWQQEKNQQKAPQA